MPTARQVDVPRLKRPVWTLTNSDAYFRLRRPVPVLYEPRGERLVVAVLGTRTYLFFRLLRPRYP